MQIVQTESFAIGILSVILLRQQQPQLQHQLLNHPQYQLTFPPPVVAVVTQEIIYRLLHRAVAEALMQITSVEKQTKTILQQQVRWAHPKASQYLPNPAIYVVILDSLTGQKLSPTKTMTFPVENLAGYSYRKTLSKDPTDVSTFVLSISTNAAIPNPSGTAAICVIRGLKGAGMLFERMWMLSLRKNQSLVLTSRLISVKELSHPVPSVKIQRVNISMIAGK